MAKDEEEQSIESILKGLGNAVSKKTAQKEAPFENYTMYSAKDVYLGNYSMPENFSDITKASILALFEKKGLKLLVPGSTKKDISPDELE